MNWYYVDRGEQAGPVSGEQLAQLVQSGKVTDDTLVWREGLRDWIPYRTAMAQMSQPPAPSVPPVIQDATSGTAEVVCAECRKTFPAEETLRIGSASVCAVCKPVYLQRLSEGAPVKFNQVPARVEGLNYAGFWIRVGAKLLDALIVTVPLLVIFFAVMAPSFAHPQATGTVPLATIAQVSLQFGFLLVNLGYQIFFLGKYGATPGKMACGLKVVTAEGGKINYARAAGRYFAELLSGMVCYIGYIIAGFDDEKRALHDHICSTRVIFK